MRFEFIRTLRTGARGVVELHRDTKRGGALAALKRLIVLSSFGLRQPEDRRVKLYAWSAADASLLWHIGVPPPPSRGA